MSQSRLYAEEKNNTIRDNFTQTTVSFSNAELAGLKSETYEDRKIKQLFAFAYVHIIDLHDYYQAFKRKTRKRF